MKWTNELPTAPGWYWVHGDFGTIEIVKVYKADGEWCCQFAGDNGAWLLTENADKWAGPIPEPTEE